MPIRAAVFDLDDTLCAYWDAAKAALDQTFQELSPSGVAPSELRSAWSEAFHEFCPNLRQLGFYNEYLRSGEPSRTELMRRALARVGKSDESLAVDLSTTYHGHRKRILKLFPDAREVLTAFSSLIPLGLMTNGPADNQREEIADLQLGSFFQNIFIEGEMGIGKPSPEIYRLAEDRFGVDSGQMLFIGNSYAHDIRPALDRGWTTVWIRRPSDTPPSANSDAAPEQLMEGMPAPTFECSDLTQALNAIAPFI